jgi:hypothetical protein
MPHHKTTDLGQGRHPAPFHLPAILGRPKFPTARRSRLRLPAPVRGPSLRPAALKLGRYCFTSKRLADDQLPGVPEAELARTRHHILVVGRVVVNCETVVFWFTKGELKVSESSIWIV